MIYEIIQLSWRCKDLSGQTFGRLTVIAPVDHGKRGRFKYLCICECGSDTLVRADSLRGRVTISCGCFRAERMASVNVSHGMTSTLEFKSWSSARERVYSKSKDSYPLYGGRGIGMCSQWDDFAVFFADMGYRPTPKHTIERIDNNLGYSPENCKWATPAEQARNRRSNRMITFNGETMCLTAWSEHFGINRSTLHGRLKAGWSVHRAFTAPVRNSH